MRKAKISAQILLFLIWLNFCTPVVGQVLSAIPAATLPQIANLTDNRGSYPGSQIPLYEKFELTFSLNKAYSNPFDPTVVTVDATFSGPGGKILVQPGFIFEDYVRSGDASNEVVDLIPNSRVWKVRFAPRETGNYTYQLKVTDTDGTTSLNGSFSAVASGGRGFLTRNGNHLKFDNGEDYYAIGTSSPWFQPVKWGAGTFGADNHYSRQATYGGNWDRLWLDVSDWASPSIRGNRTFWNFFSNDNSVSLDETPANAHSGSNSAKISLPASNATTVDEVIYFGKNQNWKVEAGQQYTFSAWIKTAVLVGGTDQGAYISSDLLGSDTLPATPVPGTSGWTLYTLNFTAASSGRFNPQLRFRGLSGTVWFDDLSLKKVGDPTELGEDTGFERESFVPNLINLDEAWKLDYVLEKARQNGVYLMLALAAEEGQIGTWPVFLAYNRYMIARWGYSSAVSAWEMCNENCWNTTTLQNWSEYMAATDPYNHLRTTSFYAGRVSYPIYNLPKIDLVQLHEYIKDAPIGSDWDLIGTATFDTTIFHSGKRSVRVSGNGQDAGAAQITAGARPGDYSLSFWARGNNVAQLNWIAPDAVVEFYDQNATQLAFFPAESNAPSNSLNGTYDWKQFSYNFTAPPGTAYLILKARGGYLQNGSTIWFDEVSLKDPDGQEVPLDYNFEVTDYYDDLAMALFREAKAISGSAFNRPLWWGELGIEDRNVAYSQSPYYAQDTNGLIFHQWLWGSVVTNFQTTGLWWYNLNDLTQLRALRNFTNAVASIPAPVTPLRAVSPLDKNPEIVPSDPRIRLLASKNSDRVVAYVYHQDYTWGRVVKDKITPAPITNASLTISNLQPNTYTVVWWNTHTGTLLSSTTVALSGNSLVVNLPGNLSDDFALYLFGATSCNPLVVTNSQDDNTCGTLRFALNNASNGKTITFSLFSPIVITVKNTGLTVPPGVNINGNCSATGPLVTINGNNLTGDGLKVSSNSTITGLRIKGFKGKKLLITGENNHLRCIEALT